MERDKVFGFLNSSCRRGDGPKDFGRLGLADGEQGLGAMNLRPVALQGE